MTRRFSRPLTRHCWSTTASGSLSVPILQVPDMCCEVDTVRSSQLFKDSSDSRSAEVGSIISLTMSA